MKNNRIKKVLGAVLALLVLAAIFAPIFTTQAQAQSDAPPADQWKFSITPYLWLPNINGTLKYSLPPGSGSPDVKVGPNDYLQALEFVAMISADVRKDRWSAFTDVIYLDFANEKSSVKEINFGGSLASSSVNVSTSSSLKGGVWTLGAGYAVLPDRPVKIDVFVGARYLGLKASTDWQLAVDVTGPGGGQTFPRAGNVSKRADLWDGIIGAKGRFLLGDSDWSIPFYLDFGTGSSSLTCQAMLGVAYSFKWGEVTLAYRDLYYDMPDDKLLQNLRFSGPALGVTFRF